MPMVGGAPELIYLETELLACGLPQFAIFSQARTAA